MVDIILLFKAMVLMNGLGFPFRNVPLERCPAFVLVVLLLMKSVKRKSASCHLNFAMYQLFYMTFYIIHLNSCPDCPAPDENSYKESSKLVS